jgi:hypothetical protein
MLSRVRSVPRRVSGPRQRRCQARATMSESDSQMPLAGGRGGLAHHDAALWAYWGGARWHTVTEAGDPACGGMLSQASGGADFDRKTEAVQTLDTPSAALWDWLTTEGSILWRKADEDHADLHCHVAENAMHGHVCTATYGRPFVGGSFARGCRL